MGKKETQVREGVLEHVERVEETVDHLVEMLEAYLDDDEEDTEEEALAVHRTESAADRIRKRTERVLFEGAFLPSHREDYFHLLERVDEVADKAEDVANHVVLTRPPVPADLREPFEGIVERLEEMNELMGEIVEALFDDVGEIEELVAEMKAYEEAVDEAEFDFVKALFRGEGDTAEKVLAKDAVEMVARVTDMIEDVGDHVSIMLVKRRA